jgi:hypothetical protein
MADGDKFLAGADSLESTCCGNELVCRWGLLEGHVSES